jgi:hypothetical protein
VKLCSPELFPIAKQNTIPMVPSDLARRWRFQVKRPEQTLWFEVGKDEVTV